jgi:hypothetical protein
MIDIDFEITKNGHTFRDSLYLRIGHGYSAAEIEAMKQARFDAWYKKVATPVENSTLEAFPEK